MSYSASQWMVSVPRQPANPEYRVLVGINYGPEGWLRADPGDVVSDLSPNDVEWMLADGVIEEAD